MTDENGQEITLGSVLWCEAGYAVIVRQDADGDYYGQLICDPDDTCASIRYALNKGRGHFLFKEMNGEN